MGQQLISLHATDWNLSCGTDYTEAVANSIFTVAQLSPYNIIVNREVQHALHSNTRAKYLVLLASFKRSPLLGITELGELEVAVT